MNLADRTLHQRAVSLSQKRRGLEGDIIKTLIAVEATKLYQRLRIRNLFDYIVETFQMTPSVAYAYHGVVKKCRRFPELREAVESQSLCVSKAARILSSLNSENAVELVAFASRHTEKEINLELARRNPSVTPHERVKHLSEDQIQVTATLSKEGFAALERVKSLLAQKSKASNFAAAIEVAVQVYCQKEDPVRRAERASKRKLTARFCVTKKSFGRTPLTAGQKHKVFSRDQGRCTHVHANGKRCNSDRFIQVHHIVPVSNGGTNDPGNLTLLCSACHDLVHQLSFPEDGGFNWLRAPKVLYGVGFNPYESPQI